MPPRNDDGKSVEVFRLPRNRSQRDTDPASGTLPALRQLGLQADRVAVAPPVAGAYIRRVSASLPFIPPCTPRPVKQPPTGGHWLHEPKLDGWRLQAVKRGKDIALYSRHGRPFT